MLALCLGMLHTMQVSLSRCLGLTMVLLCLGGSASEFHCLSCSQVSVPYCKGDSQLSQKGRGRKEARSDPRDGLQTYSGWIL